MTWASCLDGLALTLLIIGAVVGLIVGALVACTLIVWAVGGVIWLWNRLRDWLALRRPCPFCEAAAGERCRHLDPLVDHTHDQRYIGDPTA